MEYKQMIKVKDLSVDEMMRLPCVWCACKRSGTDSDVAYYTLYPFTMADSDRWQFALVSDTLCEDENGKWHVLKEEDICDNQNGLKVMEEFSGGQIRAVRGDESLFDSDKYWYGVELLVDGKWIRPYLCNGETLECYNIDKKLPAEPQVVREWLEKELNVINGYIRNGFELVSYDKYIEVLDRKRHPGKYTPKEIYLD